MSDGLSMTCGARSALARRARIGAIAVAIGVGAVAVSVGQIAERPLINASTHPAIKYTTSPTHDVVAELSQRIEAGSAALSYDAVTGYLKPVLDALHVPVSSQMLVMSKTGVQGLYTAPDNPRAIYFNDVATVGYIRGAPLLELAVQDPQQGVVFYTIDQKPDSRIERRSGCFVCHIALNTLHVPGLLARSVYVNAEGLAGGQLGAFDPDDRTPFRQRWGGWYVTGTHGSMRHMGNAILGKGDDRSSIVSEKTLNQTSLDGRFDPKGYLSTNSDIAALMVFQHQVRMTNLITRIGWETRIAAHGGHADFATGPLHDGVVEFVDYLLFVEEDPLTARLKGTSGFAEMFSALGPSDSRGRSLRQLDLERRLLKYPCSYMIYSPAFVALPDEARTAIFDRMRDVLSGRDAQAKYARLSEIDRRAITEILQETLPGWPHG
jgi:hypothetical protein